MWVGTYVSKKSDSAVAGEQLEILVYGKTGGEGKGYILGGEVWVLVGRGSKYWGEEGFFLGVCEGGVFY